MAFVLANDPLTQLVTVSIEEADTIVIEGLTGTVVEVESIDATVEIVEDVQGTVEECP